MKNFRYFVLLILPLWTGLACNLGAVTKPEVEANPLEISTLTPNVPVEIKPTEPPAPPTATPEPTALQPQPRVIDPRSLSGCDIFLDTDFPNTVGGRPLSAGVLTDMDKKACQYTFEGGSIFASIAVSLEGRDAFETVRQFDAVSGAVVEPVMLGDVAIFKVFDESRVTLEAVLNGWYVVLDGQGFDRKNLLLLAELLLSNLVPYSPAP